MLMESNEQDRCEDRRSAQVPYESEQMTESEGQNVTE